MYRKGHTRVMLMLSFENGGGLKHYLEILNCEPLICTMNHPKLIESNQMKEPISIQRIKNIS